MRIRVVLLAIVLLAAGAWLVWPSPEAGTRDAGDVASARPQAPPPDAAPPGTRQVVPLGLDGEPVERWTEESEAEPSSAPSQPGTGGAGEAEARSRPYVPRAVPGGSGRPPETLAETDAEALARLRRGEEADAEDPSDGDAGADPDDLLDEELAAQGEKDQVLPPDQLEHWIEREMRRSATDYDSARTTVLSNLALATYIAEQKAPPGATPQQKQALVDQAMNWVPNLSPEARKRWAREVLASG